jgi:hypothetical protein
MITIKLPYTSSTKDKDLILSYMKNQAPVTKFMFNRIKDSNGDLTQKELTQLVNSMNNIKVDSWFKQSSIYEAKAIYASYKTKVKETLKYNEDNPGTKKRIPTVIFGSRENFIKRCKNKISKDEFINNKLPPLVSVGEALSKGNRKFELKIIEENKIVFKPKLGVKLELQLPKLRNNYKKDLFKIQTLMEDKRIPVKVFLDSTHIYLTYEEGFLRTDNYKPVKNRIMSIDMNPNYIGYSIADWKGENDFELLKTGVISIKKLNDKHFNFKREKLTSSDPKNIKLNNQRDFEIFQIAKVLSNIAKSFNVGAFGLEELKMRSSDKGKGIKYNRLVNNMWCRTTFANNLTKRLKLIGIRCFEVPAAYSSVVGNLLYRNQPDMVGASIEINRRTYFALNYKSLALFPSFSLNMSALTQSLEELGSEASKLMLKVKGWKELYKRVKNLKLRYRVPLDKFRSKVFRLNSSPWVDSLLSFSTN